VLICLQVGGKRLDLVCEGQPKAGDIMRLPVNLFSPERGGMIYGAPPAPDAVVEVIIDSLHPIWKVGDDGALVPTYEAHLKVT
jgi:hypothetical protein